MKARWDDYLKSQLADDEFREAYERELKVLEIGVAFANERRKRGFSQERMASKLGTSAPHLSRTEHSPEHANVKTLLRYADAMDLELRFVLRPKPPKSARRKAKLRGSLGAD
jgi:transcriptional regulator with XRE-family HTH domain